MADKVTETITEQLQKAKYFSFSVDSTPDITHEDQLSLIVRFVQDNAEPDQRDVQIYCKPFLAEPGNVSVKSLSHTRWSARDDACTSLNKNWEQIIKALEAIKSNSSQQKALIKNEATGLVAQVNSLETAILSEFWGSVLKQFNSVSKVLQGVDTNIEVVSSLYDSLITFVQNQRESFDSFEKAGKEKCTEDYKDSRKRISKRKKQDDEQRDGEGHKTETSIKELNLLIKKNYLKVAFPYIEIAMRIFLSTAVTNCSAERSFSVLKRIKNYLRSSLIEERLNNLAILSIEADLTNKIDYHDVINNFVTNFVHRKKM
ncbi:hypothetical protein ACJJTC_002420 [Scirpophaga incertulas]